MALIVRALLISIAAWQAVSSSTSVTANALTGRTLAPAPKFSLPSLDDANRVLSLSSFGGKPLVVNFWALWCVPCRTKIPLLENAFKSERGKEAFVGVDSNDTPSAARKFLALVHVTCPVVSGPNGTIAVKYGLYGLPTTIFISRTGTVLGRHIGQINARTLRAAPREAFGE